ncbi:hypothetical protein P4C99_21820 [Pontiellaceae bacterium B1224]|nr:hypothetical protein [Pontiellaceae bacterium B1224]
MIRTSYRFILFILVFGVVHADAQVTAGSTNAELEVAQAEVQFPATLEPLFLHESSYLVRCRFVLDLKSDLPDDEVAALLQFISASPEEVGLSLSHFKSVADKVINALERQKTVPPALVDALMTMFRDEARDHTWRDYCIQHLGSIYANDAAIGKREQILQVWDEAMQPEVRMSGTVVLALQLNIGQEGISKAYAAGKGAEVAVDENQSDASRLTAIQVAAELGNRDMLPLAREIVPSGEYSVPFRMSSMAAIGMLE